MIYYVVFIQETKQEKEPTMEHQENLVLNFGVYWKNGLIGVTKTKMFGTMVFIPSPATQEAPWETFLWGAAGGGSHSRSVV